MRKANTKNVPPAAPVRKRKRVEPEPPPAKKRRAAAAKEEPKPAAARKSRKPLPVDDDDAPAPKKRTAAKAKSVAKDMMSLSDAMNYDGIVDGIEKKFDIGSSQLASNPKDRMSTNLLCQDIVLSGGILGGGWYTIYGAEQSAKSTDVTQILTAALNQDVPVLQWWDYEGSSDATYIANIMKSMGVRGTTDEIFGIKDPKTGQWVVKPRVRYYQPDDAETFFDSVAKLLRSLPQIKMVHDTQYYVFPETKHFKTVVGTRYDKNLYSSTGMYYVPTDRHIHHQAIILVDSYPAMLPERQDEEENAGKGAGMAAQARMFSENIKKIKAKLKSRKVTIIGVNQLRLNPGCRFGNPEYEPCGEALKLFSDVRLRNTARVIPWSGMKGMLETEPSVYGKGVDTYRYIHQYAKKNKLGAPNLECWLRLWVSDRKGRGMGFDPVYDTYEYTKMTGQCVGSRNKLKFTLPNMKVLPTMSWHDFKILIVGTKDQRIEMQRALRIIKKSERPIDIRGLYKKQLSTGNGMELFFAQKAGGEKVKKSKDEEENE